MENSKNPEELEQSEQTEELEKTAQLKMPEQAEKAKQLKMPEQLEKPVQPKRPELMETPTQPEDREKPLRPENVEEPHRNTPRTILYSPYAVMTEELFEEILLRYSETNVEREEDVTWQDLLRQLSVREETGRPLTRRSLVTVLYNYVLEHSTIPIPAQCADLSCYSDVDDMESRTKDAFSWAVSCGIVKGTRDGCLNPSEQVSRIQFSGIFDRFCACYDP